MIKLVKNIIAISLIGVGSFGVIQKRININVPTITIDIEKPSENILQKVEPISDLISDKKDRINIAIFNKEFSERIKKYHTDVQQVNDVYTLAGQEYFSDSLKGKYANLGKKIANLISNITTEDNHILSNEEKQELSDTFSGLSWALIKKK